MKNVHHFGTKLVEMEPLCVKIQCISRLNQMLNQSTITFGSGRPFGLVYIVEKPSAGIGPRPKLDNYSILGNVHCLCPSLF